MGGVTVNAAGVKFHRETAAAAAASVNVVDPVFNAKFYGNRWVVGWRWSGLAPVLQNNVAQYAIDEEAKEQFNQEIEKSNAKG